MCQAKPGKRCQSHNQEAYATARRKYTSMHEKYSSGEVTQEALVESHLDYTIAKTRVDVPSDDWANKAECEQFNTQTAEERGIAFSTGEIFQTSAESWAGDNNEFKMHYKAWAKSADEYLDYRSIAGNPRPDIHNETRALAISKMREAEVQMGINQMSMVQSIESSRKRAYAHYGEDYVKINGVPGTKNHSGSRDASDRQPKYPPLTQESLAEMMNGHPDPANFTTEAGRAVGMTPPPGNVPRTDRVYIPDRDKKERWDTSEGIFRNGTVNQPLRATD